MSKRGQYRKKYLKRLNELNEFDRLVTNLSEGEFTITHLEIAYREYIRRRKDMPEGAKNLLIGTSEHNKGALRFARQVKNLEGVAHLAYMRGRQEGLEVKDPNKTV